MLEISSMRCYAKRNELPRRTLWRPRDELKTKEAEALPYLSFALRLDTSFLHFIFAALVVLCILLLVLEAAWRTSNGK